MAQKRSERPPANTPTAAAHYVRTSADAVRARGERVGEPVSLDKSERLALCEWATLNDKRVSFGFVSEFDPIGSGAEHRVYHDKKRGLAVKATHTNRFGHSVFARDTLATASEYLRRLAWSNVLLGDEFQILGVAFDEEQIEIVSAHKWIEGNTDRSAPFDEEIEQYLNRFGFTRLSGIDVPLFYHPLGLLLADAHEANVIRDRNGDCVAIDVVIGTPGPRMRAELGLPGLGISGHLTIHGV